LWNAEGELQAKLDAHLGPVRAARFSNDGQRIATVADDGSARLWDLKGRTLAILEGHEAAINDVNFSPDGRQLLTAAKDGTARIWPIETLDELLVRGCNWLRDYLTYNADRLDDRDVQLCQDINNRFRK
jgi:WD40 repeat protein